VPEEKGLMARSMAKSSTIFSTESRAGRRGISPPAGAEEEGDDGWADLGASGGDGGDGGGGNCKEAPALCFGFV
jgi:hypothetical protein